MIKITLGSDVIEKYKKYRNTETRFKAYKMNQQMFDIDDIYEPQAIMGEGAYGMVVAALDLSKNEMVGIKKIIKPFEHREFTRRTLRELKLLRLLKHRNVKKMLYQIMSMYKVLLPRSREDFEDIYVVTQLMETDLMTLIKSEQLLTEDHWKFFMFQILEGLSYMHKAKVIHRDLKPRNVLINKNCDLKICDFGLARVVDPKLFASTSYVATRWYRAPQLLLGYPKYTAAIDLWSAGIVFAELILRKSFLPGHNTRDQIQKICNFFGTHSLEVIKDLPEQSKEMIKSLPVKPAKSFETVFSKLCPEGLDLLKKLLTIDPEKRISAQQALKHSYFKEIQKQQIVVKPIDVRQFEFQSFKLTTQQLKDIIYEEILLYHSKEFLKQYEDKKKQGNGFFKWILNNSNSKLSSNEEDLYP